MNGISLGSHGFCQLAKFCILGRFSIPVSGKHSVFETASKILLSIGKICVSYLAKIILHHGKANEKMTKTFIKVSK